MKKVLFLLATVCGLFAFNSCKEDEGVENPPYSPENIDGLWVELCDINQDIVPHIEISGSTLTYCDADVAKHDYTSCKAGTVDYANGQATLTVNGGPTIKVVCDESGILMTPDSVVYYRINNTLKDLSKQILQEVADLDEQHIGPKVFNDIALENQYFTVNNGLTLKSDVLKILEWFAENIGKGVASGTGSKAAASIFDKIFTSPESAKLDEVMSTMNEINNKLDELTRLYLNTTYETYINQRKNKYVNPINNYSNDYYEMLEDCDGSEEEITRIVTAWATTDGVEGNSPVVHYQNFIDFLMGTGVTGKNMYQVYDLYVFNTYPFEHAGYPMREALRATDLVVIARNAYMAMLYDMVRTDFTDKHKVEALEKIEAKVKEYMAFAKANEVVRNDDKVICQIEGAHFIMDKRLKLIPYSTRPWFPDGAYFDSSFDKAVPKLIYGDESLSTNEVKNNCLKVQEVEAIWNYYKKSKFGQSHSLMTALEVEGGMEVLPGMNGFQKFMITQGGYTDEPNGKDKFYFGAKKAVDMCTVLTSDLFDDRTIGLMELDWVWWKNSSYIKQWLECYSHDKAADLDDYRGQRFYRPVNLVRY